MLGVIEISQFYFCSVMQRSNFKDKTDHSDINSFKTIVIFMIIILVGTGPKIYTHFVILSNYFFEMLILYCNQAQTHNF